MALQSTTLGATLSSSGGTTLPLSSLFAVHEGFHELIGHDDEHLAKRLPSVTLASPTALPVMGTPTLPISSSVLAAIGQPLPSINFPIFTATTHNSGKHYVSNISNVHSARILLGAYGCSKFFGTRCYLASVSSEAHSGHEFGIFYLHLCSAFDLGGP